MELKQAIKESFVKIYNLVTREFAYTAQIDPNDKYIPFFENDNFPVELSNLVAGSPTATSCLSTLADFMTGEGFNHGEDLENKPLNNQGLKFFQYHNIMADSLAHDWGMASLVKYNQVGQITEIFDLPFGNCRLGVPDSNGVISTIRYNPYYGTGLYNRRDTKEYDAFNPKAAVTQYTTAKSENIEWKGQIFWFGIRDKKHPFYPVPDYYSAKYWMRVEKNAGIYFDENLENGFLQDSVIKLIGDPNDPSGLKDGEGNDIPKGKAFDTEITKNFGKGAKTRHKLMAWWANNKEEFPELQSFPTGGNADLFRIQDDHATKKITIATKVPAILANISEGVSLGGDGNTIRAAVKLMQQRVKRPQGLLIDYYQSLLRNMAQPFTENITIVPYNPYPELESVDPQIWSELTLEEKRKWIEDHTEIELIEANLIETPAPAVPSPTQPQQNQITNLYFDTYPEKAKKNVKRSLEWQEKFATKCSKTSGLMLSNAILEGKPLGPRDIKRLSRYLSKNVLSNDKAYDNSCEKVLFDAWGGAEMMTWANEKLKELNG